MTPPPPQRICSFFPTATEILYAIGAESSLIGRSDDCAYPPSVKTKPIVVRARIPELVPHDSVKIHEAVLKLQAQGVHQFRVDLNALKRLKPDLIFIQELCSVCAASHPEVSAAIQYLSPRPQVVSLNAQRLDEIFTDIRRVGLLTERRAAADRLLAQLQERIDEIRHQVESVVTRPRVWCCEWLEPLMAAGHWIPEMAELAGGFDGLGQKWRKSRWIRWEEVRAYNPEVIFVMPCSYSIPQTIRERHRLTRRPGWKSLSAVKKGSVFCIDTNLVHHAGPRLIDGLELFAHLIHTTQFPAGSHRRAYQPLS